MKGNINMIKIIKPGKTDFRKTCDKCGCIFEYNVEDIDDCYIKCPTCHKEYYGFEPEYLEKTFNSNKKQLNYMFCKIFTNLDKNNITGGEYDFFKQCKFEISKKKK